MYFYFVSVGLFSSACTLLLPISVPMPENRILADRMAVECRIYADKVAKLTIWTCFFACFWDK